MAWRNLGHQNNLKILQHFSNFCPNFNNVSWRIGVGCISHFFQFCLIFSLFEDRPMSRRDKILKFGEDWSHQIHDYDTQYAQYLWWHFLTCWIDCLLASFASNCSCMECYKELAYNMTSLTQSRTGTMNKGQKRAYMFAHIWFPEEFLSKKLFYSIVIFKSFHKWNFDFLMYI